MQLARLLGAAVIASAGALGTAGAASATPAINLGTDATSTATSAATPVYHYGGYGPYYNGYYAQPYGYSPYYAPPPPPRRYYAPYYSPYSYSPYAYNGYYGYRRPHSGVYIRTPGLRLGIGF